MRGWTALVTVALALTGASAALASPSDDFSIEGDAASDLPYLQCVPYARQVSGIRIFGDAHTWWDQAAGRYARGRRPKVGAVMSFLPYGNMRLGHVAAVSRVLDSRTVLLRHANWSLIGGRRGQIEDNVKVIDVSPANDWSEVRVWYAPIQAIGGSVWPVQGFIYSGKPPKIVPRIDKARLAYGGPAMLLPNQYDDAPVKSRAAKPTRSPIGDIIAKKMGW